ncbi:LysR family transcriptional regulator [Pseudacidovorax sp. NFM-22]|uniref:LysR family transcriptional regulator n=1 Tax=Pseudacidovorax sp. NFM-22 TaxID=2744469 RepID=UPI001F47B9D6|nr:LysR family transcriptional regulator [Pseudacidovorax sp. NFM-22]
MSEAATIRGAATRLHLSQPALSKMLGEVEAGFDARLFGAAIRACSRMRWARAWFAAQSVERNACISARHVSARRRAPP